MEFFATAAKGTEPALRDELRELRLRGVRADRGGVHFEGDARDGMVACFHSRIALRVMTPLARFEARDASALYEGVRGVDWGYFMTPRHTLSVSAACRSSQLTHTQFISQKTKDAIVDQIRDREGERPSVDRDDPDLHVFVHLARDEATVYLDLAGDSLHRRGYRVRAGDAPLKETLAAAILRLSGWELDTPLCDPMCGSGTIVIEAAMMAAGIAPGSLRSRFGFERWACHDAYERDEMAEIRERARPSPHALPLLVGSDVSPDAIELARACAARAGVSPRLVMRPLADMRPLGERGFVVTNPPYGHRLANEESVARDLARVVKGLAGHRVAVFSASSVYARAMPFRATREHQLFNGDLDCKLSIYDVRPAH